MALMVPREKWTDERLDDLQIEMRTGFTRVEGEIKRLDENVKRLDSDIKRLDGKLSQLGNELHARFESVHRSQQAILVAVVAAIFGSNAF